MIKLTFDGYCVIGDADEWLADITDTADAAQESFDRFREREDAAYYAGEDIGPWLATLHDDRAYPLQDNVDELMSPEHGHTHECEPPTGLYHDGPPTTAVSVNEDNWLSGELMVTLAHTAEYGDLLIYQHGYYTGAPVTVAAFVGDDDSDAFSWAGGYAGHADGTPCESEWIIESACKLWPNGGRGPTHDIGELTTDEDDKSIAYCPTHKVPLTFWGA